MLGCCMVASALARRTYVTDAAMLQKAVLDGDEHIIIQEHIDLRALDTNGTGALLPITPSTRSIRVRSHYPASWPARLKMQ